MSAIRFIVFNMSFLATLSCFLLLTPDINILIATSISVLIGLIVAYLDVTLEFIIKSLEFFT